MDHSLTQEPVLAILILDSGSSCQMPVGKIKTATEKTWLAKESHASATPRDKGRRGSGFRDQRAGARSGGGGSHFP